MLATSNHLNCTELAAKLGRSRLYVSAMKEAGYQMEFAGTRTTLAHAEQWLRDHPEFKATGYVVKHRHASDESQAARSTQRHKTVSTAGK